MKAPVLAFLQNMWFPVGTPETIIGAYLNDQSYRRRVLGNCMSGRRLKKAFGEHYHTIWWENASQHRATVPSGRGNADPAHMLKVIRSVEPKHILCFGAVAKDGMITLDDRMLSRIPLELKWSYFPHPNARGLLQIQLDEFAKKIIEKYISIPRS